MKLKQYIQVALILLTFFVVSCSKNEESTPLIPQIPSSPFTGGGGNENPNIPDLSRAVPINLFDKILFNGLHDIAKPDVFVPPLVGDPLVQMSLKSGTQSSITGSIRLAFEDKLGLWLADINAFDKTGQLNSQFLDIIFADDLLVVRALAVRSGDTLTGTLFYRLRQSGENACKQIIVTCETIWDPPQYYYWPSSMGTPQPGQFPNQCNATPPDVTAPCQSYMQTSQSQVKSLGSFQTTFSNWWVN